MRRSLETAIGDNKKVEFEEFSNLMNTSEYIEGRYGTEKRTVLMYAIEHFGYNGAKVVLDRYKEIENRIESDFLYKEDINGDTMLDYVVRRPNGQDKKDLIEYLLLVQRDNFCWKFNYSKEKGFIKQDSYKKMTEYLVKYGIGVDYSANSETVKRMKENEYLLTLVFGNDSDYETLIMEAAKNQDILTYLETYGVGDYRETALVEAVRNNNYGMVDFLVVNKINIEDTALVEAVKNSNKNILRRLVKGREYKLCNNLVLEAAKNDNENMIEYLLGCRAEIDRCAVSEAARNDNENIVRYLVEHGAQVEDTALEEAAENDNENIVRYLVEHGAKPIYGLSGAINNNNSSIIEYLIESMNGQGIDLANALGDVVGSINKNFIGYLVEHGVDPGCITLKEAIECNNLDLVKYLVENKPDINLNHKIFITDDIEFYETPLILAARYGDLEMVKYLVEHGANINLTKRLKVNTVLSEAITRDNNEDMVRYLVEEGADVNEKFLNRAYYNESTPLIEAIKQGNLKLAKYLVDHGADVNKSSYNAPLGVAVKFDYIDMIKYLVDKGAVKICISRFEKNKLEIRDVLNKALEHENIKSEIYKGHVEKIDIIHNNGNYKVILRGYNRKAYKRYIYKGNEFIEKEKKNRSLIVKTLRVPKKIAKNIYRFLTMKTTTIERLNKSIASKDILKEENISRIPLTI